MIMKSFFLYKPTVYVNWNNILMYCMAGNVARDLMERVFAARPILDLSIHPLERVLTWSSRSKRIQARVLN